MEGPETISASLLPVNEFWIAPGTGEQSSSSKRNVKTAADAECNMYGAVVSWISLEHWTVWVTDTGRLFTAIMPDDLNTPSGQALELTKYTSAADSEDTTSSDVVDVQGSFRSFAVFKQDGEVLTATQDFLNDLWQGNGASGLPSSDLGFKKIPALQHTGVIQLAFGDHHFHALHADGTISSYGRESELCGSLGLGYVSTPSENDPS